MTNEVVVLIVDDEPKVGGYLRILLERKIELKEKIIVHQATTIADAVKMVNEFSPDIVFLDIQMPGESGFDLLDQIEEPSFKVVFTTAYEKYAIEAINDYDCLMYLLKPIDIEDLKKVFEKYYDMPRQHFFYKVIKNNNKRHVVSPLDIVLCKASDNYCEIFLGNVKYLVSKTLGTVHNKLGEDNFVRVNRSFVVNFRYVDHIDRNTGKVVFKNAVFSEDIFDESFDLIHVSNAKLKEMSKNNI